MLVQVHISIQKMQISCHWQKIPAARRNFLSINIVFPVKLKRRQKSLCEPPRFCGRLYPHIPGNIPPCCILYVNSSSEEDKMHLLLSFQCNMKVIVHIFLIKKDYSADYILCLHCTCIPLLLVLVHGPDEVPGVVLSKSSHHAAGGHNSVSHSLKSIQNLGIYLTNSQSSQIDLV